VCSGRADLRKGNTAGQQQLGDESEKCERNSPAAIKVQKEGRRWSRGGVEVP